ncbi:MAG TPA: CPBP family glutamic-type intramembrane protease [Parachlamydiaceae bacterium]|nr:CPBP family glutamic-type intramembrane protease [Parachlamydiaceae bacterium]
MEEVVSNPLTQHLFVALMAALVGLSISRMALWKGYYTLPQEIDLPRGIPDWKCVFQAFSIFLFIEMFLVPLVYGLWGYWEHGTLMDSGIADIPEGLKGWLNLGVIGATFTALTLFFASRDKPTRDAVWGSPKETRSIRQNLYDFLTGSITWAIAYPWVIVIGQLLAFLLALVYTGERSDQAAVQHLRDIYDHPLLFGATAVAVVSIIPFIEELLFRGFLQSWLKATFGRNKAILLTSLIFAAFHFSMSQGIENVEFISSLFLLSCFLGFVKERQRSLWASVGLHMTFNFISILMLLSTMD